MLSRLVGVVVESLPSTLSSASRVCGRIPWRSVAVGRQRARSSNVNLCLFFSESIAPTCHLSLLIGVCVCVCVCVHQLLRLLRLALGRLLLLLALVVSAENSVYVVVCRDPGSR